MSDVRDKVKTVFDFGKREMVRKDGSVLFNDSLNTFYLRLLWRQAYGKEPLK